MEMDCTAQDFNGDGGVGSMTRDDDTDPKWSTCSEDSTLKAPSTQSGSGPATVVAAEQKAVYLNIVTPGDLKAFLKEMHRDFLSIVNPEESGLLDTLLADDVMTLIDNESFTGKHVHTPRDQARKLWILFYNMPVEDFKAKVFPELYAKFPHIVPKRFCSSTALHPPAASRAPARFCLRHDLMLRARPISIADLLFDSECIDINKYSELTRDMGKLSNAALWDTLFSAFRGHDVPTATRLEEEMREVLLHYKLTTPPQLGVLLSRGAPCTCHLHPEDLPPGAPSAQGSTEEGRSCHDVSRFQCNTSQYLGSDDSDFSNSAILNTLDPDFRMWAMDQGLSELTLRMLTRENITFKVDLLRLTPGKVKSDHPCLQLFADQWTLLEQAVKKIHADPNPRAVPGLSAFLPAIEDTIRILLVGKTGSGKSSSGNTILGLKEWETFHRSISMVSTTKDCRFEQSDDSKVQVMDCPGLLDTELSLETVCTRIVNAVLAMLPGPSVVLYVLKIGDRYTEVDLGTYRLLKAIFGQDVTRHMIVLFTRGDELSKEGKTIEQYVQTSTTTFKQVLSECGGRYVVFDNTPTGLNTQQIEDLKQKIYEVRDNSGSAYYSPQHFSQHEEKIQSKVHCLLKEFRKAEFHAKKKLMEGEKKEPIYKQLWEAFLEILKKIMHYLRFSGSG